MNTAVRKEHPMSGQIAILATAILMSTNGLFIKLLPWHPMVITSIRSFIAIFFLLIIRVIVPPPKNVKNPTVPLIIAAILFVLTMYTFIIANKITTAANAIVLQYSAPIWAALLGWALVKEKPRWENWAALVFISGGLLLFLRDGLASGALLGDALAVCCGICWGAYSVFTRMLKNGNPADALIIAHIIGAAVGIPFIIIYPPSISVNSVLSILYMGTIQIGLASILLAYGLKRIRAVQAMLISTIEPLLNPIWVLAITGERPSPVAIAGGAIIITTVLVSSIIGMRRDSGSFENN